MISCFKNAYLNFETARELSLSPSVFFLALSLHYSGTSPLGHLFSTDTSILVPEKRPHNICTYYLF